MPKKDFIAWSPNGFSAPTELLSVLVPAGGITEEMWVDALADRVLAMVEREPNPQEAAQWACTALDCPACESPSQLGLSIVRNNLKLLSAIHQSVIDEFPFPNYAIDESLEARDAIQSTNLELWVGHAEFLMNGIRLATYVRSQEHLVVEPKSAPNDESLDGAYAEIKPYIDFINKHQLAICDANLIYPDAYTISTPKYDFSYSLTHQNQWVRMRADFLPNQEMDYGLLSDFDKQILDFNEKHATKISCLYDEKKPFFFKPIYKPSRYTLKIEAPLSEAALDINKILTTFYGDILYFFNCGSFDVSMSEAKSKRGSDISFPVFLEKLIGHLDLLRNHPDYEHVFDIDA
jgi:hypothetical protein